MAHQGNSRVQKHTTHPSQVLLTKRNYTHLERIEGEELFPSTTSIEIEPRAELTTAKAKTGWSIRQRLKRTAYMLEEPHIVTFFLLIVYTDIILGTIYITGGINNTIPVVIHILRNMILYLQCIELLLQMILFHIRFFSHWGFCFDTIIVGAKVINGQFNVEISAHTLHLLSFARVWRFILVVQSYIANEISRHNQTKVELSSLIEYAREYKRKITLAEEEIEVLNEALTVAALDAAEMRAVEFQYQKDGDNDQAAAHDE